MSARHVALHGTHSSAVFELLPKGAPVWRHWGGRVETAAPPPLAEATERASFALDEPVPFAIAPPAGLGWFGQPLLKLRRAGEACAFEVHACTVEQSGGSVAFVLDDEVAQVRLVQSFGLGADDVLRCTATVHNLGDSALEVEWLASALLPLPAQSRSLLSWRGRHNAEFVACAEPMPEQAWLRETRRGLPGHGGPPGLYVLGEGATLHGGPCFAAQLAWPGDTRIVVERHDEGYWTLAAGAVPLAGELRLAPGQEWRSPELMATFSPHGRGGAMRNFHRHVRAANPRLSSPRPVHLNSWEACYFAHDEARMLRLAEAAAELGVERFVLDDGWFMGRRDDRAGLGDWAVDPAVYPRGLKPLAQRVNDLGMEFGLWVEPEMVNPDSALFRRHPDWVLAPVGRPPRTARHQLVLDLRRPEVRDHLFTALHTLLRELPIAYLKWDHNRDHAPGGGVAQTQGALDLLARVRAAHPHIAIEGCAGGGGRIDAASAALVDRFWTSDNLDAVSRLGIQRGFLAFLPPEMMGAHVGASPAHATGRAQPLAFRAAVAVTGHLGLELDPDRLAPEERLELARWIAFYKRWRGLLHDGDVWLGEGPDGLTWQAHVAGETALLFVHRAAPAQDTRPQPLPLPFVVSAPHWRVRMIEPPTLRVPDFALPPLFVRMRDEGAQFDAAWLREAGLPLPRLAAQSAAVFALEPSR
jgi:alpha-galactosidase